MTNSEIPLTADNADIPIISCITAPHNRIGSNALWDVMSTEKDLQKKLLTIGVRKISDATYADGYIQGTFLGAEYLNTKYLAITHAEN